MTLEESFQESLVNFFHQANPGTRIITGFFRKNLKDIESIAEALKELEMPNMYFSREGNRALRIIHGNHTHLYPNGKVYINVCISREGNKALRNVLW